ncbi:MAG TPA: F0F1 ATP synthase subunit epsilon [Firmicutes bacterium]|nr:F0F1 ATP synthase subunit epsilon [Bacillota bacterium]HHY98523.1 F0F1 ATP synthase subunit epsilon [Bacillota bacterium]
MARQTFDFKVITPSGTVLSRKPEIVVLPGAEGDFALMHGHVPMIAKLKSGKALILHDRQKESIVIASGFVMMRQDQAIVFTREMNL